MFLSSIIYTFWKMHNINTAWTHLKQSSTHASTFIKALVAGSLQ